MANRLKGITLEIGGNTEGLSKALKDVNKEIKDTQAQLKDVEKLLKMDPTNIELLRQKEKLLADAVSETKTKLEELNRAQEAMDASNVDKNSQEYMALQREIIATKNELGNLETAADKSNAALQKVAATADKVAAGADKVANATKGMSLAAGAALGGIGAAAYKAVTSADDLNTLAKQTGFTTAELQKMQYAADRVDVSVDSITSSAKKLKKNMASSAEDTAEAFERLGVSTTDINGNMRDATEVYWDVISALSQVGNETERDQLAMKLLGNSADSLAGIIDDGGEAFRQLGQEAEDAGLIMSQETLDDLNAVNDQIDEIKAKASATLTQSGAKALEAAMPLVEKLIDALSRVLEIIGKMSTAAMGVVMTILAVIAAISPLASLVSKISSLVSFITTTVIPNAGPVIAALTSPIALVTAAVVAVIAVIALFGDQIQAVLQKVDDFLQGVFAKDWQEVFGPVLGSVLNAFMQNVKNVWDSIKKILDGVIDIIRGVFTGNWKRAWEGVIEVFKGIFSGITAIAKAPINAVIGLLNGVIGSINSVIERANSVAGWVGVKFGTLGQIPLLANGGVLTSGSAIVGEAGPELLTVAGGRSIVQPLTATLDTSNLQGLLRGNGNGSTQVNIEFTGSLAQLGKVLRPVISNEASRVGGSLITY